MSRPSIRRSYVDAPWGQIHLATAGSGPTILLLHQTPRSWDEFASVIDILSDSFHLVAMDLPGMGASDPHPDGASIVAYAEAATRVLDDVTTEPAAVCGHHTGGVVAMQLAVSEPTRVSQLFLSSTPWVDDEARRERARSNTIDSVQPSPDGSHLSTLWHGRAPYYPEGDSNLLTKFVRDALRCENPADGHHAVSAFGMENIIDAFSCPVTILEHSADPFGRTSTRALADRLPRAKVVKIADGMVPLEATAERFAECLAAAVELPADTY